MQRDARMVACVGQASTECSGVQCTMARRIRVHIITISNRTYRCPPVGVVAECNHAVWHWYMDTTVSFAPLLPSDATWRYHSVAGEDATTIVQQRTTWCRHVQCEDTNDAVVTRVYTMHAQGCSVLVQEATGHECKWAPNIG